ncbi:MAG: prolyl oligopeptidase family serine peptidase [Bdellovibrionaceae bacterium]|nr:prolyl oligopeptidase family serine peptidase [Pseudobdellovibrionaceae bacterium]
MNRRQCSVALWACLTLIIQFACSSTSSLSAGPQMKDQLQNQNNTSAPNDPYLWLEDVEGESALKWVRERNQRSTVPLESRPEYKKMEAEIRKILLAKDRIPSVMYESGHVYNFWQDEKHVRGIWRRMPLKAFQKQSTQWEILIDLDQLAREENENWVWQGANFLHPHAKRAMITLSRGGKDAAVEREWDLRTRAFVKDGFVVPEAKSNVDWMNENALLVATEMGPNSMTKAGYPRQVRLWTRGQSLAQSKLLLEVGENDMSAYAWTRVTSKGTYHFVSRVINFWESRIFLLGADQSLIPLPIPQDVDVQGVHDHFAYMILRSAWQTKSRTFPQGSLVSIDLDQLSAEPQLMLEPTARMSPTSTLSTRDAVFVQTIDNVKGGAFRLSRVDNSWKAEPTTFPTEGDLSLMSSDSKDNVVLALYESFLTPPQLLLGQDGNGKFDVQVLRTIPERFRGQDLVSEQREAVSADGTRIPYFIVRHKNTKMDGQTPTILYGYGGFEVSMTPFYLGATGKIWLEEGGAWVLANIRGGGEFGPRWHQAALLKNRQKAFDDFIAISEDLIHHKVTSPSKLAIMGGSNGGLLVGATFTQRPDLFRAVVCQVPLLDMLRYHKLLAGHSWMAEYGDPDDPEMAQVIQRYSPYQNVTKDKSYPTVFFMTSTKDDRVHPGHARKMAARMEEFGHKFEYYENIEGGHGAAANLEQRIHFQALTYTFLRRELGL